MKTENWRNIKDALTIAVLLFVDWKTWQIEQIKPNVVTVTEYIPGDTTRIICSWASMRLLCAMPKKSSYR